MARPGQTNQEDKSIQDTRMRDPVKRKEQLMTKRLRGSRGHITEDRGPKKRDGDHGEGGTVEHGLNRWTGELEGRQGGEIGEGEAEARAESGVEGQGKASAISLSAPGM